MVSGTRIMRDGYEAPTPVAVLSAAELTVMAQPNLVDAVNRLPQFSSTSRSINQATDDIAGGISNLNLRGLQPNRTLVLLDGHRLVGSTIAGFHNNGGAVDVNVIPANLVSRVDVITGGASAAYGSDALSGVVNFVLDKTFTGLRGGVRGGVTTYGDDANTKADLAFGTAFAGGRGHLLVSGEHAYNRGIAGNNRPWARRSFSVLGNPSYSPSNGSPAYLALFDTGLATATPGGLIVDGPLRGTTFGKGGLPGQFTFGPVVNGLLMAGGDWRLSRIDNEPSLDIRNKRHALFSRLSYDVSEEVQIFAEFHRARTNTNPPSGVPQFRLGSDQILSGNPFIPAAVQAQMTALNIAAFSLGTTNPDLRGFAFHNVRTFERAALGAAGDINVFQSSWKWAAHIQYSRTGISATIPGDMLNANYALAIDAVRHPADGRIVCRSSLSDPGNGCIPFNPMGVGVNSQAAIDYVTATGQSNTALVQKVVSASVSGEPFALAAGPISLALGAEFRREAVGGFASALDQAASFFAGNFTATEGAYEVAEGYAESSIPLVRDAPWADSLELNGALRATSYSTSGHVTTWKVGTIYAPLPDLSFRATRSRDIRAPNLGDLFNAGRSSTGAVLDPSNNVTSTIFSRVRGNPDLAPEKADTVGVGAVLKPTFLAGFAASVDYYDIAIEGAIQSLSEQQYVDLCFQGNRLLCSGIQRDPSGIINFITIRPQNVQAQKARGLDFEISYRMPASRLVAGWQGDFSIRGLATRVISLKTISPQGLVEGAGVNAENAGINVAGLYAPKFKYNVAATYSRDPVALTLTARGVSAGKYGNSFVACTAACPPSTADRPTINLNHIDAVAYFDVALAYTAAVGGGQGQLEVFFTAENVFDRDPPLIAGSASFGFYGGQDNQFNYDRLGRFFHAGLKFTY